MGAKSVLIYHQNNRELNILTNFLKNKGFELSLVQYSESTLSEVQKKMPDLILLSTKEDATSELDFCYQLKSRKETEQIFIVVYSNTKQEELLVRALEAGADDFIFQPINQRLLIGKLNAILRRKPEEKKYSEGFWIDKERFLIINNGEEYQLPKKEFEILNLLSEKPNKVFTREEIKNNLWENSSNVRGRTIDVHIRKIREKIGLDLIATVKGVGYKIMKA